LGGKILQHVKHHGSLLSKTRDFTTSGQLTINIFPKIKEKISIEYFEEPLEDEVRIENYFGNVD
jgi:hypothetical protein